MNGLFGAKVRLWSSPDDMNADGKVDIADFVTILNLMAEQ